MGLSKTVLLILNLILPVLCPFFCLMFENKEEKKKKKKRKKRQCLVEFDIYIITLLTLTLKKTTFCSKDLISSVKNVQDFNQCMDNPNTVVYSTVFKQHLDVDLGVFFSDKYKSCIITTY